MITAEEILSDETNRVAFPHIDDWIEDDSPEAQSILHCMKKYTEEAIKADRINLLEHVKAKNGWSTIDKDSILNAPIIQLL